MRVSRSRILQSAATLFLLTLVAATSFAADSILLGGLNRRGVANETIRVPVVIDDNTGTPAGADQVDTGDKIRYIAFKATFSTDALVAACGTSPNCTLIEAGIAPTLNVTTGDDPCGAADGTPNTPCFFRAVTTTSTPNTISYVVAFQAPLNTRTAVPRGDLVAYLKLKLSPTFPAGGTVTITPASSEAFLSGFDIYSNDGNPSSEETVANTHLTVGTYQPADANNDNAVTAADLTKAEADLEAATGVQVTASNFRSDCDGDNILSGADVLCVHNELNPSATAGTQTRLLDVDLDGNVDALTDGLLILRRAFTFGGTTLTTGVVATGAARTDPAAIASYIDSIAPVLDVDGAGGFDALTDGLLLFRSMFGFTGTTLTANAVATGAPRSSAALIEGYITQLQKALP